MIDSSVRLYDLVIAPLSTRDREDFFQDMKTFGVAMGIPPEVMPENWPAFTRYFEDTLNSDTLRIGQAGRRIAQFIIKNPLARCTAAGANAAGAMASRVRAPVENLGTILLSSRLNMRTFPLKEDPAFDSFVPSVSSGARPIGGAPRESKTAGTRAFARFCEMLNLPFSLKAIETTQ